MNFGDLCTDASLRDSRIHANCFLTSEVNMNDIIGQREHAYKKVVSTVRDKLLKRLYLCSAVPLVISVMVHRTFTFFGVLNFNIVKLFLVC